MVYLPWIVSNIRQNGIRIMYIIIFMFYTHVLKLFYSLSYKDSNGERIAQWLEHVIRRLRVRFPSGTQKVFLSRIA